MMQLINKLKFLKYISEAHQKISKRSYYYQAMAKKSGINFYYDLMSNNGSYK